MIGAVANGRTKYCLIENKFKAIPEIEQLREYSQKVQEGRVKVDDGMRMSKKLTWEECQGILLAPKAILEGFCWRYRTPPEGWRLLSYEELCLKLEDGLDKIDDQNLRWLIERYVEFVRTLVHDFSLLWEGRSDGKCQFPKAESDSSYEPDFSDYSELRVDDVIKKLWGWKLLSLIGEINGARGIVDFSRNQPLIGYYWNLQNGTPRDSNTEASGISVGRSRVVSDGI